MIDLLRGSATLLEVTDGPLSLRSQVFAALAMALALYVVRLRLEGGRGSFVTDLAKGRAALTAATEEHLMTPWRFMVAGKVASENPRYIMLSDAVFHHWAHHRGQMTVYLRLMGAQVPALYGPSADDKRFD